jgi:hypothetical protein
MPLSQSGFGQSEGSRRPGSCRQVVRLDTVHAAQSANSSRRKWDLA